MKTSQAKRILKATNDTMISYALLVGGQVMDGARTEEDAKQWCAKMVESDVEYFKSPGNAVTYEAIVIDAIDGTEVTMNNLHAYLKN